MIENCLLDTMSNGQSADNTIEATGTIMKKNTHTYDPNDPFDLKRFTRSQEDIYDNVLAQLKNGRKRSHWMWYIFPQIDGLGFSPTTRYYSIKSKEEAQDYLHHPILGPRLRECAMILLETEGLSASVIFGFPDNMKLKSSMTLFASVSEEGSIFKLVLKKFFNGKSDEKTIRLLEKLQ